MSNKVIKKIIRKDMVRKLVVLGILLSLPLILTVSFSTSINPNYPSLPLSQIAKSWTDNTSVDSNLNGIIDLSELAQNSYACKADSVCEVNKLQVASDAGATIYFPSSVQSFHLENIKGKFRIVVSGVTYAISINGTSKYLGIWNDNPQYPLDINGNTRISGSLDVSSNVYVRGILNVIGNAIIFGENAQKIWDGGTSIVFGDNNEMVLYTEGADEGTWILDGGQLKYSSTESRFYILPDVLINTQTVLGKLTVNGTTTVYHLIINRSLYTSHQDVITFVGGPSSVPYTIIDYEGHGIRFWNKASNSEYFVALPSETRVPKIVDLDDTNYYLDPSGNSNLAGNLYVGGNVGIGTTSPSYKLHIKTGSTPSLSTFAIEKTVNEEASMKFITPYNIWTVGINSRGTLPGEFFIHDTTNGIFALVIQNGTGYVGIGTTSPAAKLDVVGGVKITKEGKAIDLYHTTNGGYVAIILNSKVNQGSDRGFIIFQDDSSYVGSGRGSENSRLIIGVYNDFNAGSNIADELWLEGGARLVFNVGDWDDELDNMIGSPYNPSPAGYEFRINNQVKVKIDSSGNVGIGTTTPSEKLEVVGNVKASKFIDRDNTNYYLDPAGTSVLNNLNVQGTIIHPDSGILWKTSNEHVRTTFHDGCGNFQIMAGAKDCPNVYVATGSGAAEIEMDYEGTNGVIYLKVAPTGTAGLSVSWTTYSFTTSEFDSPKRIKAPQFVDRNAVSSSSIVDGFENEDWSVSDPNYVSYDSSVYRTSPPSLQIQPNPSAYPGGFSWAEKTFTLFSAGGYWISGSVTIYYSASVGYDPLYGRGSGTLILEVYDENGNLLCRNFVDIDESITNWDSLSCSFSFAIASKLKVYIELDGYDITVWVDDVTISYNYGYILDLSGTSRMNTLYVNTLTASTKNAIIRSRFDNSTLIVTGAWEGPYYEILYRGKIKLNSTEVIVYFPYEFRAVTDGKNYDVLLTPIGKLVRVAWEPVYDKEKKEIIGFKIIAEKPCEVSYLVIGRRWDIQKAR